jgi:hypothetical protein
MDFKGKGSTNHYKIIPLQHLAKLGCFFSRGLTPWGSEKFQVPTSVGGFSQGVAIAFLERVTNYQQMLT